jgi:hypothetical protein
VTRPESSQAKLFHYRTEIPLLIIGNAGWPAKEGIQAKHDLPTLRNKAQRLKSAGTHVVELHQKSIDIQAGKARLRSSNIGTLIRANHQPSCIPRQTWMPIFVSGPRS